VPSAIWECSALSPPFHASMTSSFKKETGASNRPTIGARRRKVLKNPARSMARSGATRHVLLLFSQLRQEGRTV